MKDFYDYLIVGAGLYSAVFAYQMTQAGKRCLVIDKRQHIGGNVYCREQSGITVHQYGAHIFHTDDRKIWEFVNQFAAFNQYVHAPIANYHGEVYNLPFNMNTFSKLWGISSPEEAWHKIQEQAQSLGIVSPRNLEEQALSMVGPDVYEKLIKGYTEKQWGRSCKDLPSFIIQRLPLRFMYDNRYFNDRYQGIPVGGYTGIIRQLLEGSEVLLGVNYFDFRREHPKIASCTLFTGPIDAYYDYCFGSLAYRSLRFETCELPVKNFQGSAVVNYTAPEISYTRIIEHKHFEFGQQPTTILTYEYPEVWYAGAEPYYPVNDEENTRLYRRYAELASHESNVIFGGRLGEYRYYDMDDVIAAALEVADSQKRYDASLAK